MNTRERVVLVGEMPPQRWALDARYRAGHSPLYPHPPNSAGARLKALSGLGYGEYIYGLERVNLMHEWSPSWNAAEARRRAMSIVTCLRPHTLILCGGRVATAFGVTETLPLKFYSEVLECNVVAIPHPSGRCRLYNQDSIRQYVREAFDEVRPLLANWQERRREARQ